MNKQSFTQIGTFSLVLLVPIILLMMWLLVTSYLNSRGDFIVLLFLLLVFLACLATFYKLTIEVRDESISFRLGAGLVRKSFRIVDIESCNVVRNSPLYGIGIRLIKNGWLYNVSGLRAIELRFKGKNTVVRIGTDKPNEVCQAIQLVLKEQTVPVLHSQASGRWFKPFWLAIAIVLIFPLVLIIWGSKEPTIKVGANSFSISGMYGETIPFHEVTRIDMVSSLPKIARRTNGFAFRSVCKGYFATSEKQTVKLFVNKESKPFILIERRETKPIYVNFSDCRKTELRYKELNDKLNSL